MNQNRKEAFITEGVIPTMIKPRSYHELHKDFQQPPNKYRPIPFVRLDGDFSNGSQLIDILFDLKRAGYGGIAPVPVSNPRKTATPTTPAPGTEEYWAAYEALLEKAKNLDMQAEIFNQPCIALSFFPSGAGEKICTAVEISNPEIILSRFCKKDDGVTIRLFNSSDAPNKTVLTVGNTENEISFGAFEVKTFRYADSVLTETEMLG